MDKKPTTKELLTPKSNFLIIELTYNYTLVLPYKEGIKLLAALEQAECLDTSDYANPKIIPTSKNNKLGGTVLSQESYLNYKLRGILLPTAKEGEDT